MKNLAFEKQKWIKELTPFLSMWKNINTGNDLINKKLSTSPDEDPLTSFFSLESENGLKLIKTIHNDLTTLSKVLRGVALITNDIFELAGDLMKQKTPESYFPLSSLSNFWLRWLNMWEGPETPSAFMKGVIENAASVFAWKDAAKSGELLGNPIQLSKLFNPPTFLNALRQITARKSTCFSPFLKMLIPQVAKPIDSLMLCSTWIKSEISSSPIKCQVEGLLLQGCRFDGTRLTELTPDDPTFIPVPICNIAWMPNVCPGFPLLISHNRLITRKNWRSHYIRTKREKA